MSPADNVAQSYMLSLGRSLVAVSVFSSNWR